MVCVRQRDAWPLMTSRGRLLKELKEQQGSAREADITLQPDENNIYRWAGYLQVRAALLEPRAGALLELFAAARLRTRFPALRQAVARCAYADACAAQGPPSSPYEGGTFHVSLIVPEQYPLSPPAVKFVTKVFHPNIHWKARERDAARGGAGVCAQCTAT